MNYEYKIANLSDIDILVGTRIDVLRVMNNLDETTEMLHVRDEAFEYYQKSLQDGSHVACLVYDEGKIIGTGGISFYQVMPTFHNPSGYKAYIMNIYTYPDYRRKGIARKILDLLVSEAKKRNINVIHLEATDMGKQLYERYGFVSVRDEMKFFIEK